MPAPLSLLLTVEQRAELEEMRDHAPQPYLRERAAALLKVANGQSASQVARQGLLRQRHRVTVSDWVHRYQAEGLAGLRVRAGRGRKPCFSPSAPNRRQRT